MQGGWLLPIVLGCLACGPKELAAPKTPGEPCDTLERCGDGLGCHGAFKNHQREPGRCTLEPGRCLVDRDCPGPLQICDVRPDAVGNCIEAPSGIPRK